MGWVRKSKQAIERATFDDRDTVCRRRFVGFLGGSIVVAGGLAMPAPANAVCEFNVSNTPPPYSIRCFDNSAGAAYTAGVAPTLPADTTFDMDVRLVTDAFKGPTFIDSGSHGISIDGTPEPHDVEVRVNPMTAIRSSGAGVAVATDLDTDFATFLDQGPITINQSGFIEAEGAGVSAESVKSTIVVTNAGIIGVEFDDLLVLEKGVFKIDTTATTLSEGGAFELARVGGAGISATVTGELDSLLNRAANIRIENQAGAAIYSTGHGIQAVIEPGVLTFPFSSMNIINWGTIGSAAMPGGANGIIAIHDGLGPVTVRNLSMNSIVVDGHGIEAKGNGPDVLIYNGDDSTNADPLPDNPDGRIDAGMIGVTAENRLAGSVKVFNGLRTDSNSEVHAGGEYGIKAVSTATVGDREFARGIVEVWNFGHVESWATKAVAAIYAETTELWSPGEEGGDGYAAAFNGGIDFSMADDYPVSLNARINGYDFDVVRGDYDMASLAFGDSIGIEVRKLAGVSLNGEGGLPVGFGDLFGDYFGAFFGDINPNILPPLPFSTLSKNYGSWDFTGADHFLTPGFFGDGAGVVDPGSEAQTVGGVFAPAGRAWVANNLSNASTGLWNYGTVIGEGLDSDPVLDINTKFFAEGAGSVEIPGEGEAQVFAIPNLAFIHNAGYMTHELPAKKTAGNESTSESPSSYVTYGVIGSRNTPHAWRFDPDYAFKTRFGFRLGDGVDWDFIDNTLLDGGELERFKAAAGDRLLRLSARDGDGAGLLMINDGLLIGNLLMEFDEEAGLLFGGEFGDPNAPVGEGATSLFINGGSWFVRDESLFGGDDADNDAALNFGLVQAAFAAYETSQTDLTDLEQAFNFGVFSLLDGGTGDRLVFDGSYAGGLGDEPDDELPPIFSSPAYFALDAYLAEEGNADAEADVFQHNDAISGSTGLIIRNAKLSGSYGINQAGIEVVEYFDTIFQLGDPPEGCGLADEDAICMVDDPFFISGLSPNYFEVGGVPLILDGLYAWALWHDEAESDFELRSGWGPGAWNAPKVISGAQFIADGLFGIVADHVYGHQFFDPGGSGADLVTDYVVNDVPAAPIGTRSALWLKAVGSWTERDTTLTEMGSEIDTRYDQDVYSILGGADMKPGGADSSYRFGVFGGYVTSTLDFEAGSPGSQIDYDGGSAGAYAAYNDGAFYVDATVKGEYLDTSYSFDNGVDVDADVINVGVAANTGYRMTEGFGFVEPLASLRYVYTTVEDVSSGDIVDFSNGHSVRAGVGARLGASFANGGGSTEISLLGRIWNEFDGDNEVTVSDGGLTDSFTDDTSGVFGEAAATVTMTSGDGALSGFVSGGSKFGEDFTSWNAQAGLRKGF